MREHREGLISRRPSASRYPGDVVARVAATSPLREEPPLRAVDSACLPRRPQASSDARKPPPQRRASGSAGCGAAGADAQQAGPRAERLGTSRTEFPPLVDEARLVRYSRRSVSSTWLIGAAREAEGLPASAADDDSDAWVRPVRPARCGWRRGEVSVHGGDGTRAHYSGSERCGSIWACPVCAAVIRAQRAAEIMQAVTAHQEQGGGAVFLTLTLRHRREDPLALTLDAVLSCWRKLLAGRAWGRTRTTYGIEGYIRSIEVTHGLVNGWHPHAHVLLLTKKPLSRTALDALGDDVHDRWARYVEKATGRRPTRLRGVDVQAVDGNGEVLARYLAKVQEDGSGATGSRWDVGAELSRGDVKTGGNGHHTPMELTDLRSHLPGYSDAERVRLWVEFVTATKGRRAITWSRGLKARYSVAEVTDEEVLDETVASPPAWVADGPTYDRLRGRRAGLLAVALDHAEAGDWATVGDLLGGYGLIPPAPDPDSVTEVTKKSRRALSPAVLPGAPNPHCAREPARGRT